MAEVRLVAEVNGFKAEVARLRKRLPVGIPTVYKDLSLISLALKCSGFEAKVSLEEFIDSIEAEGRIGKWQERDSFEIAVLKL